MRVDRIVEDAILESIHRNRVNLLSEEAGFVDNGSAVTLVIDPVDGSANAAFGVPLSCFAGAVVEDGTATEALTTWFDTAVRGTRAQESQRRSARPDGRRSTARRCA